MLSKRFLKFVVLVLVGLLVLAIPLNLQAASEAPSIAITGVPGDVSCTGGGNPSVPIYANLPVPASDTGVMSVAGAGVVATITENTPVYVGATGYGFLPSAFSVPTGTPITITITTYNGPDQTGGIAFVSTIIYECGTGTLISITGGGTGGGLDMVPLPDSAVVGTFTQSTPLHYEPSATATTDTVMEVGKSLWVLGVDSSGAFYKVLLSGQAAWVPVGSIGPTYDDVWNGTPLPTEVVN